MPDGTLRGRPNARHATEPLGPPCLGPSRPRRAQVCHRGRHAAAVQTCCRSTLTGANPILSPHPDWSVPALPPASWPARPPPPRHPVTTCCAALTSWDRWSVRAGRQARSPRHCRGTPTARDHRARWRRPTLMPRRRREQRRIWRTLSPLSWGDASWVSWPYISGFT